MSFTRNERNTSNPARWPCSITTAAGSVPSASRLLVFSYMRQLPAESKPAPSAPKRGPILVSCE